MLQTVAIQIFQLYSSLRVVEKFQPVSRPRSTKHPYMCSGCENNLTIYTVQIGMKFEEVCDSDCIYAAHFFFISIVRSMYSITVWERPRLYNCIRLTAWTPGRCFVTIGGLARELHCKKARFLRPSSSQINRTGHIGDIICQVQNLLADKH